MAAQKKKPAKDGVARQQRRRKRSYSQAIKTKSSAGIKITKTNEVMTRRQWQQSGQLKAANGMAT